MFLISLVILTTLLFNMLFNSHILANFANFILLLITNFTPFCCSCLECSMEIYQSSFSYSISLLIFWLECYIPHMAVVKILTIKPECSAAITQILVYFLFLSSTVTSLKVFVKDLKRMDLCSRTLEKFEGKCLGSQSQVRFQVQTILFFQAMKEFLCI